MIYDTRLIEPLLNISDNIQIKNILVITTKGNFGMKSNRPNYPNFVPVRVFSLIILVDALFAHFHNSFSYFSFGDTLLLLLAPPRFILSEGVLLRLSTV